MKYTRIIPARAAPHCVKNHSYELDPQIPTRSPRFKPSDKSPAATWSACYSINKLKLINYFNYFLKEYKHTSCKSSWKDFLIFWCKNTAEVWSPYTSAAL